MKGKNENIHNYESRQCGDCANYTCGLCIEQEIEVDSDSEICNYFEEKNKD